MFQNVLILPKLDYMPNAIMGKKLCTRRIEVKYTNNVLVFLLDALVKLCEAYYEKVNQLEGEKYDMEKEVELKDYRVCNKQTIFPTGIIFVARNNFLFL